MLQLIGTMRRRFASGDTYQTSDIDTTRALVRAAANASVDFDVVSNPEFLREGFAVDSVHVPVFLSVGHAAVVAYCVVFLALVAVLVIIAKFVATRRPIAEVLERWEHVLFPIVLIALGIFILVSGLAFSE